VGEKTGTEEKRKPEWIQKAGGRKKSLQVPEFKCASISPERGGKSTPEKNPLPESLKENASKKQKALQALHSRKQNPPCCGGQYPQAVAQRPGGGTLFKKR